MNLIYLLFVHSFPRSYIVPQRVLGLPFRVQRSRMILSADKSMSLSLFLSQDFCRLTTRCCWSRGFLKRRRYPLREREGKRVAIKV